MKGAVMYKESFYKSLHFSDHICALECRSFSSFSCQSSSLCIQHHILNEKNNLFCVTRPSRTF